MTGPRTSQWSELDPARMRSDIERLSIASSGGIDTSKFVFFDDFVNGHNRSFPTSAESGCPWIAAMDKGTNAKMTGDVDGGGWATLILPSNDGNFSTNIVTDGLMVDYTKSPYWEARIAVNGINGITTAFYGFTDNLHFTLAGSYELLATDDNDNHSTGFILDPETAYKLAIDASDMDAVKFYANDELIYTTIPDAINKNQWRGLRFLHSKAESIGGVQQSWIDYVLCTADRSDFQLD